MKCFRDVVPYSRPGDPARRRQSSGLVPAAPSPPYGRRRTPAKTASPSSSARSAWNNLTTCCLSSVPLPTSLIRTSWSRRPNDIQCYYVGSVRASSPRSTSEPKAEGYCSRGDGRASPGRWARRNPWPRRHPCQCDFRRPKDRRSRPQQWKEAVDTLMDCLDAWQNWRDNLPAGVADSAVAERLDTILELRDLVEQLEAAELLPQVAHIAGYNLFSFTRASAVVKCQSALTCFLFRLCSQAATSSTRVSLLGIRRSRH